MLFTDHTKPNTKSTIRDTFTTCTNLGLSFYSHEWDSKSKELLAIMGFDEPDMIPCALCITEKRAVYLYTDLFDHIDKYTFTLEKIFNARPKIKNN